MREDLDEALVRDFPFLYQDRNADSEVWTRMNDGFCVGDGWEPLIRELSSKLEPAIMELPEREREACKVFQCKEKFGGLRFYTAKTTPRHISDMISEAEQRSFSICEVCGAPGQRRLLRSWIYTSCKDHKKSPTYFISGPSDLTQEEFNQHYSQRIATAIQNRGTFVIGDDPQGTDRLAQQFLKKKLHYAEKDVVVYHVFDSARSVQEGFRTKGGYATIEERDAAMTLESEVAIVWVRGK